MSLSLTPTDHAAASTSSPTGPRSQREAFAENASSFGGGRIYGSSICAGIWTRGCRSSTRRNGTGSFSPGRASSGLERSEEHTSELQSHSDLVCRLLLEKKKKSNIVAKIY